MNNTEKIEAFKQYCIKTLEEETKELKNKKESLFLKGKLAKIQLFNEHLDILKQKLQQKTTQIIGSSQYASIDEYHELEDALSNLQKETINDYLFSSFLKNNLPQED